MPYTERARIKSTRANGVPTKLGLHERYTDLLTGIRYYRKGNQILQDHDVPRIVSAASAATPTPNADTTDVFVITAQAAAAAFAAPSGSPTDGQQLIVRVTDDATARALTWNAIYRAFGASLPESTTISNTIYLTFIYNAADTKWDCVDVRTEGVIAEAIVIKVGDETTNLSTGTTKHTFRMPYAFRLSGVRASANTAPTDATVTVDINEGGATILSTKLTIDSTEKTSTTAATPAVISDEVFSDDAEITIDIDQIGSTIAGKGLKVVFIGSRI